MATLTSSYQYLGRSEVMKSNGGSLNYYMLLFAKTSKNTVTGVHTVTTKGYLASTNDNATFYQYSTWFDAYTNGVRVAYGNNFPKSSWEYKGSGENFGGVTYKTYTKIFEASTNVDCSNGLKKTINLGWYYEFNGGEGHSYTPTYGTKRSLYVDVVLEAIPRESTVAVDLADGETVQMGSDIEILIYPNSSSFTHKLEYVFGGLTETIATGVADSYTWTVPDMAEEISGELSWDCTVVCYTYSGSTLIGSDEINITLTVPNKSKPRAAVSSVQMGKSVNIYTDRKSTAFTHTLTYSFGGVTGTIATGVEGGKAWTVPDLVSKIPGKSSGTCTITCKTYTGSTLVGTDTTSLTLTIPDKSTPSASDDGKVQMGKPIDIYTNRKSTAYTHKLIFSIGGTEVDRRENVEGGRTWTPDKNLASKTGNKLSTTCKVNCETYNGTLLVGTASTEIVLSVPDATVPSLSATSIVLGEESITIKTPREADCYEHDISYTLKASGSSAVALSKDFNGSVQESYEWTPSLSLLAPAIPSATKGTITVTCTTRFKGSTTVVGTADPVSFTVTIPDNSTTKPKVTMTLSPVHTLSSAFDGVYVQGKSKVKVTYTASSDYSTIASYSTNLLGATGETNPYTSSVLINDETVSVVGNVKDARGYSTEKTDNIEVISYKSPKIIPGSGQNKIVCTRSNSDGTVDPGGVYLLIKIGRHYEKVVSGGIQKNYCKLSYSYKTDAQDDSSYSTPVELLAKDATTDYVSVVLPNIVSSNTTAYNIRLIAEDDVGESDVVIVTVPTAFAAWHVPTGGHGFTVGGYHDPSKYNVFDCLFDAEFEGNVQGKVLGLGKLPEIPANADFNDYKEFGAYSVASNDIARSIANCPSGTSGVLRVWSANGRGDTTGVNVRIMQEYICDDNSATYRRSIQLPDEQSSWDYKGWKTLVFS